MTTCDTIGDKTMRQMTATLVARVSDQERAAIERLARTHDRRPSGEVRRAIRFYLTNFELADRALREQADKEQQ